MDDRTYRELVRRASQAASSHNTQPWMFRLDGTTIAILPDYERFALQATALGVRNAFINQPAEAAAVRHQFAGWLDLHGRMPDLVVRFGYGPEMPRSVRRPIEQILA